MCSENFFKDQIFISWLIFQPMYFYLFRRWDRKVHEEEFVTKERRGPWFARFLTLPSFHQLHLVRSS